jgi:hypothetical protein
MSIYIFVRFGLILIALFGWILFQLIWKKKRVRELKLELMTVIIVTCVYASIYYWVVS